jgi:CheY-like chemotaxis protein
MNQSVTATTHETTSPRGANTRTALPPRIHAAFAEALLRDNLVTVGALQDAMDHANVSGLSLADALGDLEIGGDRQVYRVLAEAAGLFFVDPTAIEPSPLALRLVPGRVARRHGVLPLAVDDDKLTYVTTRPFDAEAAKDVAFTSGRRAVPVLSCAFELRAALDRFYPVASDLDCLLAHARTAAVVDESSRVGVKPVVLLADDQPLTRTLVHLFLNRDGYTVVEAHAGERAVELARQHGPALIVIDLNMPQMSGYHALATLRKTAGTTRTPTVVVTAEDGPAVEQQVLALGADDYIAKPFEPSVLTARIKAVFARQRMAA